MDTMKKWLFIAVAILISANLQSQTDEEKFNWGRDNFRSQEDSVISLFQEAKKQADTYWYAKYDAFLAMIESRKGHSNSAHTRYTQSLELLKSIESDDISLIYQITRNLAAISYNIGNYESAAKAYSDGLSIDSLRDKSGYTSKQKELDLIQQDLTRFYIAVSKSQSRSMYEEGNLELAALYKKGAIHEKVFPRVASEIGLNNYSIGENEKALSYFHEAVIADKWGVLEGSGHHNIAKTFAAIGDTEKAQRYFEMAKPKMKSTYGKFHVLMDQGKMWLDQGKEDKSLGYLLEAVENHWKFEDNAKYLLVYDYISTAYSRIGEDNKASAYKSEFWNLTAEHQENVDRIRKVESVRAAEFQAESIRLMALQSVRYKKLLIERMVIGGLLLISLVLISVLIRKMVNRKERSKQIVETALSKIKEIDGW
ncbi:hypothetical protein AWW68_18820 [Roseivirga spongicola]|uniref:MalT-like TPR region domain-containing protein n=2 Tax=Roseivirga spongicola TaxID=333140 RepID=A0A150XDY1_9BACT|nr:hypothetical protein AWW68_18820 [Roseivirga spongicola]